MLYQPIALPHSAADVEHRHRPRQSSIRREGEIRRGTCMICGVSLIRTEATRIWFQSGQLG
jgi:hypothetical protein